MDTLIIKNDHYGHGYSNCCGGIAADDNDDEDDDDEDEDNGGGDDGNDKLWSWRWWPCDYLISRPRLCSLETLAVVQSGNWNRQISSVNDIL